MRYILVFIACLVLIQDVQSQAISGDKILPGTLIIKFKDEYRASINGKIPGFDTFMNAIADVQLIRKFPGHNAPAQKYNGYGRKMVDLSLIYELKLKDGVDINKTAEWLNSQKYIEYAQPYYLPELLYDPDDPLITSQYYLYSIQAFAAWDTCKGDSAVTIGITDTGTDFTNPDNADNIQYNYADPINGFDDDSDGFVDNLKGWDTGDNDFNPQWNESITGKNPHGVGVQGSASARVDNTYGIAGPGFYSKVLPVKVIDENGLLSGSYEGIVYAADHNCQVINCSWGGIVGHPYGQDIVNYATFNRNALVVASAGNNNNDLIFFPASYENVLSVGATNYLDYKWTPGFDGTSGGSNYGIYLDLCAPGAGVYTNWVDGNESPSFISAFGTSFSSPIAAGCAAIVKARYSSFNALQVGEVLRVTADNIDTISFNSAWAGYLGSGRINLFRAITDTLPPSVRIDLLSFTSYPGNTFSENDTVSVSLRYTNYLAPVTGLTATISTLNPNVEIIRQTNNIGSLGMLDTASNYLDPFVFRILPGIDFDEQLIFKVTFQGDDYEDYQYFDLIAASSCLILDTNRIATTITAEGKIGYQEFYPLQGIGFIFDDTYSMLSEGGLMIGFSENHVSSCIRGYDDFSVAVKAEKVIPPVFADCEITASYDDEGSAMGASGILINQTAYAWADVQKENFIFMNYQLINNNSLPVDSFFLGFFTDWDIENLYLNIADYDSIHNFSYVFSNDGSNLYTGLKLLSGGSSNHYAFNNVSGGAGGIDIYDIFTIEERYEAMSSTRHHAGPGDVADLLSAGPLYLDTGDTINVAFAIVAAVHMNSLITAMEEAQDLYDSLFVIKEKVFTGNDIVIVSPNPVKAGRYIVVDMGRSVPSQELTSFELVDVSGRISTLQARQKTGTGEMFTIQIPGNLSGVFILRIKSGDKTVNRKLIISD